MRKLVTIILTFLAFSSFAQNFDTLQNSDQGFARKMKGSGEMRTLFGDAAHTGGYFAINFKGHNYFDQDVLILGVKTVGVINRSLGLGFEANAMLPSVEVDNIDLEYLPEDSEMRPVIGYGGLVLEPIFLSNTAVHVTFPTSIGAGWVGYIRDWNENLEKGERDLLDDAVFFYLEPGVNVEFNLTRNTRLGLGASYRTCSNFDLESTSSRAFNGLNLNMLLKFGHF